MTECSCPACQVEVLSIKVAKGLWLAEIMELEFAYGRGKTRKQAEEDVMGYWYAAINGLN